MVLNNFDCFYITSTLIARVYDRNYGSTRYFRFHKFEKIKTNVFKRHAKKMWRELLLKNILTTTKRGICIKANIKLQDQKWCKIRGQVYLEKYVYFRLCLFLFVFLFRAIQFAADISIARHSLVQLRTRLIGTSNFLNACAFHVNLKLD